MNQLIKNEIGNRYGRLIVLEEAGRDKYNKVLWNCKCDCGNEKIICGCSLRKGNTCSCGCIHKEKSSKTHKTDEIGNVYGRLVVFKEASKSKDGSIRWLCSCDCGNEKIVVGRDLRSGGTKSCGCLRKEIVSLSPSVETRRKISIANFGKLHSIETKRKMSIAKLGENNPAWNLNLADEDRINRRNILGYYEWRMLVFKRDNYTCQCCGDDKGGNLNAHHLESYNGNLDLRIDLENGITLCKICHNDFHHQFGYGNNTKEQFIEFMSFNY